MADTKKTPSDDFVEYEQIPKLAAAYTKGLMTLWEKMGKPTDLSTNHGWIVLDSIVQIWQKHYPQEVDMFIKDIKEDREQELPKSELVKHTLYNPITFPHKLYTLIKTVFPDVNIKDKKFIHKLATRYPFLKSTNLNV